ncbi:MAG: hypothetical protein ABL856_10605, partial [Gallionella sp.]
MPAPLSSYSLDVSGAVRAKQFNSDTTNISTVSGTFDPTKIVYQFDEGRGWGYNNADNSIYYSDTSIVPFVIRQGGNVGIGTTSPYAMLSVAGQVVGQYFTATSTSQASIFNFASTTAISGTTAQFTTASSTNLFLSGLASGSLLKVTAAGAVTAAVAGTDYVASTFAYLFPNNATTTSIAFNGGLTATGATSTNLFGGRTTGNTLAIGSSATTTIDSAGNTQVAGTLGVTGNTTLANATSTNLAITALSAGLPIANSNGSLSNYAGTSCTNQFVRSLNGSGVATCATVQNADLANSSITINGSSVSLGGSITVASTTLLANSNTFTGANIFTQTITGAVSGNAGTATALQNARTINGVSFDGTANITITAASSTLLADSSKFSGVNTFTGNTTLANATSTNLAVTAVTSSLLKTNSLGSIIAATAGTDYLTSGTGVTSVTQNGGGSAQNGAVTLATSTISFNGLTAGIKIINSGGTFTFAPTMSGTLDNSGLTNSTISGIALGSNLADLTATNGTLTFSGAYNGGTART